MRSQAHGVIVLRCAEPERPGADLFEDLDQGRDARIFLQGRCADQRVSIFPEEVGISVRDSREFPSGHGCRRERAAPFCRKKFGRCVRDAHFGATGVGDQRVRRSVARDFRKEINCRGDGKRDVDQIGVFQGGASSPEKTSSSTPRACASRTTSTRSQTADAYPRCVFAKRQSERSANQAGAENRDARNEVTGRHR